MIEKFVQLNILIMTNAERIQRKNEALNFLEQMGIVKDRSEPSVSSSGVVNILKAEPIEKIDRQEAAAQIIDYLDNNGIKYKTINFDGHNRPRFDIYVESEEGSLITIHLELKDRLDFQKGARSGNSTAAAEALQAISLQNMIDGKSGEVSLGDISAAGLDSLWKRSIEAENAVLFNSSYLDKNKSYFVCKSSYSTDSNYKSIYDFIRSAYRRLGVSKADLWNPSDIYVVVRDKGTIEEFESAYNNADNTFDSINTILLQYLNSKDIIGISLKRHVSKSTPTIDRRGYNPDNYTPSISNVLSFSIRFLDMIKSPAGKSRVICITENASFDIDFRTFHDIKDMSSPVLEIIKTGPGERQVLGKTGSNKVPDILSKAGIPYNFIVNKSNLYDNLQEKINLAGEYSRILEDKAQDYDIFYGKDYFKKSYFDSVVASKNINDPDQVFSLNLFLAYIAFAYAIISNENPNELLKDILLTGAKDHKTNAPYLLLH